MPAPGARTAAAAQCLAHGNGTWEPAAPTEPYLIETSRYMPHFNLSSKWWGVCDDDVRTQLWTPAGPPRRPPRPALGYTWTPRGPGCERFHLPSLQELTSKFCSRWQNRTLLFVGDSHQAQMFTSFVHMVGFTASTYSTKDVCWKYKRAGAGSGAQEVDQRVTLCAEGPLGVLAIFRRNEALLLDPKENDLRRRRSIGRRAAMLCDWHLEMPTADFVLLNRGMWRASDDILRLELNATFAQMARTYQVTSLAERVLYRSTFGTIDDCSMHPDPISDEEARALVRKQASSHRDPYERGKIEHQNGVAHEVASTYGIPFWDIYPATVTRTGGRRFANGSKAIADCGHFCLPGPPDELTRELLAYLITFRN